MESGTYHFLSAQEPTENTSVYDCMDKFAIAMLQRSLPTLLVSGGTHANIREMKIAAVMPFFSVWPWWSGHETKSESLRGALHSALHEAFVGAIYGRPNNFNIVSNVQ